jgi:hypothetical protein
LAKYITRNSQFWRQKPKLCMSNTKFFRFWYSSPLAPNQPFLLRDQNSLWVLYKDEVFVPRHDALVITDVSKESRS